MHTDEDITRAAERGEHLLDELESDQLLLPCECVGTCAVLVFENWDKDEFYGDVLVRPVDGAGWLWRLKAAKRALFGQQIGQEVVLGPDQARLLRNWLDLRLR